MRKTIAFSLLFALVGIFAMNLSAETAWTTTDVEPASWTALSDNLLYGLTGTKTGTISTGYGTTDMGVLTDGVVPMVNGNESRVAFQNTGAVEWSFTAPKTLEQVRVSGCYLGGSTFTRISISAVYVKLFGSDTWTALDGSSFLDNSGRSQNVVICASLADPATGYLAQGVAGLKVAFGANVPLASYIVEIEAVGFAEATGPVVGSFDITPAKTKAELSGSIADPGTDATECDVYLSLDGGAATKIASGVTGSFGYQIQGLTAGMEYAYVLSVSNNASAAKGAVREGTFTTLAADAQTASWSQGEYAPADWTALENNILSGLNATETSSVSGYASQDMTKLTDGSVPNPAAGAETVGFQPNGTIAWTFEKPKTITKLRISSLWESTAYNGISVNAIHVKYPNSTEWEALDVPTVQWTGGTLIGQMQTLSDAENGFLAQNVVGLKITFGEKKAAFANYYAEIEAIGRENKPGLSIFIR
jgi:hypothetical protein